MDPTKVHMVRSAKGNDMLCVDNFLYYYDDRGLTTYRWSCNRRKDKSLPCKSRIITKIIGMDESKHTVVKICGEHQHERCSAQEVSKAVERKKLANLSGHPCTLEAKSEKRKLLRNLDYSDDHKILTKKERRDIASGISDDTENGGLMHDKEVNNENNIACHERSKPVANSKDSSIYMLKTSHGRDMVWIEGYLYRLEGTSTDTYRWECTRRRNDRCKGRVQTRRIHERKHVLKDKRFGHTHPPYAHEKLLKLLQKHYVNRPVNREKIRQIKTEKNEIIDYTQEFEEINVQNSSGLLKEILEPANADLCTAIIKEDITEPVLYENEESELDNSLNEKHSDMDDPLQANAYATQSDLDLSKVCLLPSSKGKKLLCIDNFLYHFESRCGNKQRIYWTCVHRRDKFIHCRARVTTDGDINKNLKIVKISGPHSHPNEDNKIKERLCNQLVVKAANAVSMRPKEFLKASIKDLDGAVKEMVIGSMDTIRKKISKLRYKIKRKKLTDSKYEIEEEDNDSISSIESDFYPDDDVEPPLPMKLEEMKVGVKDNRKEKHSDTASNHEYDKKFMKQENECENADSQRNIFYDHEKVSSISYKTEDETGPDDNVEEEEEEEEEIVADMDLKKISTLRSAKGGELLCIDSFLYHLKSARDRRIYWECIKCKHKLLKCKSRVITITTPKGYVVTKVTNDHSHPSSMAEVDKRVERNLRKSAACSNITANNTNSSTHIEDANHDYSWELKKKTTSIENSSEMRSKTRKNSGETRSVMKLYSVSDGPPSLAVRMTLKALKIPYELVNIDYCAGEHMTEEYAKMNPQKEIPVLDDDGFYLPESIAIMQYLCDKYAPHNRIYPTEVSKRAVVNQRLCFNMGFYYASISAHAMAPIFFDYPRTEMSLKKVNNALAVFETYLQRAGTKYAAAEFLTIADFALVTATMCLEAIDFDFSTYPLVKQWYENFKVEFPTLWAIGDEGMKEIMEFEKNPPDLSNMNHPFHPTKTYKYHKA